MRSSCVAFAIFLAVFVLDPAHAADARDLHKQCLAIAQANHGSTPGSTYKQLGPHKFRMRKICADWSALAASDAADQVKAANALAGRCMKEARFDLSRSNEPAFERHEKASKQMCRDQLAYTLKAL